mmetsp:Transcript_21371/g.52356  ORF Transcript_21371/g.52356 Transcript_21371/m.52356 type:complete len:87 (-) Transcript_21371:238-498(-)|eukprot:CAMPEP_0114502028 /NCGR_PEP_ID=MMETSP0109-20121206/8822_1 /TAXON_ID=29199 /ORGANISM="Chlorarachnion reptans, Strain CCCM449" /LENGTH=86 /DNA_ID=CAMNT_0001679815 /DNA_START=85 /DNA_END=345 /DNA_ORIENTATION=-
MSREYIENRKRELHGLLRMKNSTDNLVQYLQNISKDVERMNNGMEAVAKILKNWENVFEHMQDSHPAEYVKSSVVAVSQEDLPESL